MRWLATLLILCSIPLGAEEAELFTPIDVEVEVVRLLEEARRRPGYRPIPGDEPSPFELLDAIGYREPLPPPPPTGELPATPPPPDTPPQMAVSKESGPETDSGEPEDELEDELASDAFVVDGDDEVSGSQGGVAEIKPTPKPVEVPAEHVPMPAKVITIRGLGEVGKLKQEFEQARKRQNSDGAE